jgi:hypothetical protein
MREFVVLMDFRSRGGKVRSLKVAKKVLNVLPVVSVVVMGNTAITEIAHGKSFK